MARLARAEVFDPGEVSVFHGINRCVRRCFLCGHDPLTGNNFDHRKRWLEDRFRFLEMASAKRGAIPTGLAAILSCLGIDPSNCLELAVNFGRLFQRVAGRPSSIARQRTRRGCRFRPGHARLLVCDPQRNESTRPVP